MLLAPRLSFGTSKMGLKLQQFDGQTFPLGELAEWPEVLIHAVQLMLDTPIAMQVLWGEDSLCLFNDSMAKLLPAGEATQPGAPAHEVWSDTWPTLSSKVQEVLRTGQSFREEDVFTPMLDGDVRTECYFTHNYSPLRDGEGKVLGVLDVAQDTTGRVLSRRADAARQLSERHLAAFARATSNVLYRMNADWTVLQQLNGQGFIGNTENADPEWVKNYIPESDQPRLVRAFQDAISNKTNYELEHRVYRVDGSTGWALSRAVPVFGEAGEVTEWFGMATDITRLKEAEDELRTEREQLQLALDSACLAAWFYDPERNVVGGDARMGELFGLGIPEGPAQTWLNAIVEDDRERVGQEFAAAIQGAPYDTEYRVTIGGRNKWIRATAKVTLESSGLSRMLGICEDITPRKEAEAKLTSTVERLALAEQIGKIAAWEWDLETGELSWDEAGLWVYGRPPSEVSRIEQVQQCIHPDDVGMVMGQIQPVLQGEGEFNCDFRVCWPDGSTHWLSGRGKPIFGEHGSVKRLNGVNIDITDRRSAEIALRVNEKLAVVGQLASTIAHEINNPLESVTNLLFICKTATDDAKLTMYLDMAEAELQRMGVVANQTLRFHKQSSKPSGVTCIDLFSNSLLVYQARINNARISVEKRKRAEQPVICLEGEIRQVMNNLIGNAVDALKNGGRLFVRSTEATDWKTGRKGLRLTVADTGPGMTREVRMHLYEPFFTTKGIGGTGLGLWISREIVERHKGRLSVRSSATPGRSGTVFSLFLPFGTPASAVTP